MSALISPVGIASVPINPKLIWHPSSSATSYFVQVATDSLFSSVVEDSTVTDTLLQLSSLSYKTKYFWHIRSMNVIDTSAYSVEASFITALPQPALISPVGITTASVTPKLIWHLSSSATSYLVQIATDSLFTSIVEDSTVADTLLQVDTLAYLTKYFWHVRAMNTGDSSAYSAEASFTTSPVSGVQQSPEIPRVYALSQNYPNPFNPSTVISYSIPQSGLVKLSVYNLLGQKVATLVDKVQYAGIYQVSLNASRLASGIYIYRIESGKFSQVKKMMLLK